MIKTLKKIPPHLKKYIVKQNITKYTAIDHAVWRFIMKQLTTFLEANAHQCYIEGLEKTGISLEEIPSIENINKQLNKFGWSAVPVSGFIPPAAFMELQSLGILPIASDMRTLEHLNYTPAPDIVHEAAGHAPILIHPEFSDYLHQYAQVAAKAILSHEDLALYDAIRILSDLKESPKSTAKEIEEAERKLLQVSKNISHISEAAELARMNWWTAEYGLIGDIKNPKIYGAGLLSSVSESRSGLTSRAKKIPMSLECIKYSYDITEPQPQLFVTPDFETLKKVLNEFRSQMAFMVGGVVGLEKSKKAKTVNTVELDTGVQISGKLKNYHTSQGEVIYLQFEGPCQLAYKNKQLEGHGKSYHKEGYGTALGKYSIQKMGKTLRLNFDSGVTVEGVLFKQLKKDKKTLLLSFKKCKVTYESQVFFEPAWGVYDMAIGTTVTSVFGGPADKKAFGELESFVAHRVAKIVLTKEKKKLNTLYAEVRNLRNKFKKSPTQIEKLKLILSTLDKEYPTEWLLRLEVLELLWPVEKYNDISQNLLQFFSKLKVGSELRETIQNSLRNITKISDPSNTRSNFFAKAIHSTLV